MEMDIDYKKINIIFLTDQKLAKLYKAQGILVSGWVVCTLATLVLVPISSAIHHFVILF